MDCPKGKYCQGLGNINPTGYCSAGFFCEGGSSSEAPNAGSSKIYVMNGPCPAGHFCEKGTPDPTPCPRGRYRNTTGTIVSDIFYQLMQERDMFH